MEKYQFHLTAHHIQQLKSLQTNNNTEGLLKAEKVYNRFISLIDKAIRKLEATELEINLNPKIKQFSTKNKLYPVGRSTMGMPGSRTKKI